MTTELSEPVKPAVKRKRSRLRAFAVRVIVYGVLWEALCGVIAWQSVMPKRHYLKRNPSEQHLTYLSQSFKSADGTRLAAWIIPAASELTKEDHGRAPVVILCHGVDSTRESLLPQAKLLHEAGFAVFMFDFRARGESGGDRCTLGYRETEDLLAAVAEVKRERPGGNTVIGVLGQSQGAAVTLMAAGKCADIKAVCAESPYARLDHAVANHFYSLLGAAGPLLGMPTRLFGELLIEKNCSEISPLAAMPQIGSRPVLLIEDGADTLCPPAETQALLRSSGGHAQLLKVPGAGHIQASWVQPDTYRKTVLAFFKASLKPAP